MRTVDENGVDIESPNLNLGHLVSDKILIAHHPAQQERKRIVRLDIDNPTQTFPNGGKIVSEILEQEYSPAVEAWDEYEDIMRYVLYTTDELAVIAEDKKRKEEERKRAEEEAAEAARKAAEREEFLSYAPNRLKLIESAQLDTDEAVSAIYEESLQARLDMDEALVAIYESRG